MDEEVNRDKNGEEIQIKAIQDSDLDPINAYGGYSD